MKKRVIEGVEVEASSGNVFADLDFSAEESFAIIRFASASATRAGP